MCEMHLFSETPTIDARDDHTMAEKNHEYIELQPESS